MEIESSVPTLEEQITRGRIFGKSKDAPNQVLAEARVGWLAIQSPIQQLLLRMISLKWHIETNLSQTKFAWWLGDFLVGAPAVLLLCYFTSTLVSIITWLSRNHSSSLTRIPSVPCANGRKVYDYNCWKTGRHCPYYPQRNKTYMMLESVLHVPHFRFSLVYVSKLAKRGISTSFSSSRV